MTIVLKNVRLSFVGLMPRGAQLVRYIVGYDSQKLLPSPERLQREYYKRFVDAFTLPDIMNAVMSAYIDFDKPSMIPLPTPMVPFPDVRSYDDLPPIMSLMEPRERTYEHKVAIIKVADLDYAVLEARVLSMYADRRVRAIVLDIESDPPARDYNFFSKKNRQMGLYALGASLALKKPKKVATAAGKRDMGYLKHDRTKQHKRRKR